MSNTDKYIPEKILKRPPCWWNWNSQPGCIYVRLKSKILRQYWYLKPKILQRLNKVLFGFGKWMSFKYHAYVFPGINLLTSEFQKLSLSKWGQVLNLSCENGFYLHENEKSLFHIKGWGLNLVLRQRPEGTRKWPIANM